MITPYLNWKIKPAENQVVYVQINCPNNSTNVLSQQVLIELDEIIGKMRSSNYKTVVFCSQKKGVFIAGANEASLSILPSSLNPSSFLYTFPSRSNNG